MCSNRVNKQQKKKWKKDLVENLKFMNMTYSFHFIPYYFSMFYTELIYVLNVRGYEIKRFYGEFVVGKTSHVCEGKERSEKLENQIRLFVAPSSSFFA